MGELGAAGPRRNGPATTGLAVAAIAALLGGVAGLVYLTGGTHNVLPHLFYVPIMLAVLRFGIRGGIAAAIVATVLCGPVMPLDVASGEPQQAANWLARGAFFLVVGSLAGQMVRTGRRTYERGLTAEFEREIDLAALEATPRDDGRVEARIRQVLDAGSFHPVFQPIYSLDDGRLVAVEVLTRFTAAPQQPPNVWFAQAADVGMGRELELAAIEVALDASHELPAQVALSVNCSPSTLTDPRFRQLVSARSHRRLIVEVTEHAVVDDYLQLSRALSELRVLGIELAVDDVGAGISSLRHIVRLSPDILKLDISLTQHLHDDPVRRALADCLIQFARRTGSALIAEGIEDADDLATWTALGASAAQGYLLGRPAPLPAAPSNPLIGTVPLTADPRAPVPVRLPAPGRR